MTVAHERYVSERFDATEARFRAEVALGDHRLDGVLRSFGDVRGVRVLDLGCGKGRFARHLARLGAEVVGLDASRGMIAGAEGIDRVLGSAMRLPFGSGTFGAVLAVEVFEHLPRSGIDGALSEIARVLEPGGRVAIVDKNLFALDAQRPWLPKLALKWIDERRGRWMYPARGPVRERWFSPRRFADQLRDHFRDVNIEFLMSSEESRRAIFRRVPRVRLMTLWTGRASERAGGGQMPEFPPSPRGRRCRGAADEGSGPRTNGGLGSNRSPGFATSAPHPSASPTPSPTGRGGQKADPFNATRSDLPLALWRTPPGLDQILMQEGVPAHRVQNPREGGRFVLFDGRTIAPRVARESLSPGQTAIDVDAFRRGDGDPFAALVDDRAAYRTWTIAGFDLTERVSRFDKAAIRRRVVAGLRSEVERSGGIWARLSAYPHPYRSAFNFRADLDEPFPDDYARFARARRPIDDCSTHFVSTAAYAHFPEVMADLKRIDAQSHGHFHHVYRSDDANVRNLQRADALLRAHGFAPSGFAGPEGRWNPELDRAIHALGYAYSSDFQIGYGDLPFWPIRDGRPSPVLQIPVHPICEGLFLDAGCTRPLAIADHLIATVRDKAECGDPAFVYGHPERRLGRFPEIVSALASAVSEVPGLWRVTLTEFARWWRWRADRAWSMTMTSEGRCAVDFDGWDVRYPLALEIVRGDRVAIVPLSESRQTIDVSALSFANRPEPREAVGRLANRPRGLRSSLRSALDWETVTPLDELPEDDFRDRLKKRLRAMRTPVEGRPR